MIARLVLLAPLLLLRPVAEPEIFAPGVISTADDELNAAFTPDQNTIYFSSYRGFADTLPIAPGTAAALAKQIHGIRNGLGNIYRVPIEVLPK